MKNEQKKDVPLSEKYKRYDDLFTVQKTTPENTAILRCS